MALPGSRRLVGVLLLLSIAALLPVPRAFAAAVLAHSAADVCGPTADPCVIAGVVDVAAGSVLDFGLRALRIEGQGSLDFAGGDSEVKCGRLDVTGGGAGIRVAATSPQGAGVLLLARRHCFASASRPCLVDADCDEVAADSCSGGSGQATIAAAIAASGEAPGRVSVRSAGDLVLLANANLAGARRSSDGGSLELESTLGSVTVSAAIDVSGGGAASGGSCSIVAAGDVTIDSAVVASGGDYDGGSISIAAGGDARIRDDLGVEATGGAGMGGELGVEAARDIVIAAATASKSVVLSGDGHQSSDGAGGDGGSFSFDAGRDIVVSRDVRLLASGAPPDGFADTIAFDAGRDLLFDGDLVARGRGASGGGGDVEIVAASTVRLGATAAFDLTGPAAGGDFVVENGAGFSSSAAIDVSGGGAGVGGRVVVTVAGDVDIAGSWSTAGAKSLFSTGDLLLEGCHVRVAGHLANAADAGRNRIVARESFALAGGGEVLASGTSATNAFVYRSAVKPPALAGRVSPSPSLVVDGALAGCAVCGNGELDAGEGCDDGNVAAGDGCSAHCQDEGCEAETIGDPVAGLCSDADECTDDRCDVGAHHCVHTASSCDDDVACTTDSCAGTVCVHERRDQFCDDGNACTTDGCSAKVGCVHEAAAGSCDDGLFCNGADSCAGGSCSLHEGDPCAGGMDCRNVCNEGAASCLAEAGRPCSDDANPCTDDACDGLGSCAHRPNRARCDDGSFCDGADACASGSCSMHGGNPCALDGGCAEVCNDAVGACEAPPPCRDDGDPCTADFCDAAGACVHPPVNGACDDGNFCSVGEVCSGGSCPAGPPPSLFVSSLKIRAGRTSGRDRGDWRFEFPASSLPEQPSDGNLRVVFSDAASRPLFDATLPAGSLKPVGARGWRFKAARGQSAHGIASLGIATAKSGAVVRARLKLAAVDLSDVVAAGSLAAALLFGDEPGGGACSSSAQLVCERAAKGLDCASPP